MDSKNIIKAIEFATEKHANQFRKYSGEPYITHPIIVAEICRRFTDDTATIIGAILHDVYEDTPTTLDEIENNFGKEIREIVYYTSEVSSVLKLSRKERKKMDRKHYCSGNHKSKLIKIADAIHNCECFVKYNPKFATMYIHEKFLLVEEILKSQKTIEPHLMCAVRHFHSHYGVWMTRLNMNDVATPPAI